MDIKNIRLNMSGVRSLGDLYNYGSSSRVLNLLRTYNNFRGSTEYESKPFFSNTRLNRCLIVKHNLRRDEKYLVNTKSQVVTKIIFPFTESSLEMGGQSIFIGQQKFGAALAKILSVSEMEIRSDLEILETLNKLPSFDPFLLSEYLRQLNYDIAKCYFEISPSEVESMNKHTLREVSKLVNMAFNKASNTRSSSLSQKMVDMVLADKADENLEPLRIALSLKPEEFRDGIFGWRGFIYYKWQLENTIKEIPILNRSLNNLNLFGKLDYHSKRQLAEKISIFRDSLRAVTYEAHKIIKRYDNAFAQLIEHSNAEDFKFFLLDAPKLFIDLGQQIGIINHICSFWNYRFKNQNDNSIDIEECREIIQEFIGSLVLDSVEDLHAEEFRID